MVNRYVTNRGSTIFRNLKASAVRALLRAGGFVSKDGRSCCPAWGNPLPTVVVFLSSTAIAFFLLSKQL